MNPAENILGIDPGKTGGFVLLSPAGSVLRKEVVPLLDGEIDLRALAQLFFEFAETTRIAFLEKVHGTTYGQRQSISAMFNFGSTFGALQMGLVAFRIPYELVPPVKWARAMHAGVDTELEPKAKSKMAVMRLFPRVDLRATERSRVPHDGLVDALLIAEYGRRFVLGMGQAAGATAP